MFAFLSATEIETCKYRGIFTIEDLADLTQEQAKNLQLSKEYETAKKFVSFDKNIKNMTTINEIEQKYQKQITGLEEQIKKLSQNKKRGKSK